MTINMVIKFKTKQEFETRNPVVCNVSPKVATMSVYGDIDSASEYADDSRAGNPFLSADLEHELRQQRHENALRAQRERQLQEEYDDLLDASRQQKELIAQLQVCGMAQLIV